MLNFGDGPGPAEKKPEIWIAPAVCSAGLSAEVEGLFKAAVFLQSNMKKYDVSGDEMLSSLELNEAIRSEPEVYAKQMLGTLTRNFDQLKKAHTGKMEGGISYEDLEISIRDLANVMVAQAKTYDAVMRDDRMRCIDPEKINKQN